MDTCTIETGLLRKKPCGSAAVARCANCEQALCVQHAVPQLNSLGKKTGTFLCQECVAANKQHEKAVAAGTKHVEAKRQAGFAKSAAAEIAAGGPNLAAKKPAAPAPAAPPPAGQEAPKEAPKESGALDFAPAGGTPGGKIEYTRKKDDPGTKGG